jgi:hypothetical protein
LRCQEELKSTGKNVTTQHEQSPCFLGPRGLHRQGGVEIVLVAHQRFLSGNCRPTRRFSEGEPNYQPTLVIGAGELNSAGWNQARRELAELRAGIFASDSVVDLLHASAHALLAGVDDFTGAAGTAAASWGSSSDGAASSIRAGFPSRLWALIVTRHHEVWGWATLVTT